MYKPFDKVWAVIVLRASVVIAATDETVQTAVSLKHVYVDYTIIIIGKVRI